MHKSSEDSVLINVIDSTGAVHPHKIYHRHETVIPRYGRHTAVNSSVDGVPEHMRIYFFIALAAVIIFFWWVIKVKK